MRIFLTGGHGMVGRNSREHPKAKQHHITAPPHKELDLLDFLSVKKTMQDSTPDVVIHTAGKVGGIIANMEAQGEFLIKNFEMGKNLLVAAKELGIKKFINLGSSCIYPKTAPNPLKEESMLSGKFEPTNEGYGLAKMAVLKLCQFFSQDDKTLQYKTLIPPNLFGRYDNFDATTSHFPAGVIRKIHQAVQDKTSSVALWGDGSARRELMSAFDVAEAIWFALEHLEKLPAVTNVGINHDITILDYYNAAASIIGFDGEWQYLLDKPVGMKQKIMDSKFFHQLGFAPTKSLEDGIKDAYNYFLTNIAPHEKQP
ncbi:MAG: NAD-dependent epimerase/dehydratase family protein [Alphaproteobacteria bacterium]